MATEDLVREVVGFINKLINRKDKEFPPPSLAFYAGNDSNTITGIIGVQVYLFRRPEPIKGIHGQRLAEYVQVVGPPLLVDRVVRCFSAYEAHSRHRDQVAFLLNRGKERIITLANLE